MNYTLRQTLGLESAEVFSPSTIILDKTEVSPEVELVNEVQEVQEVSTAILKASTDIDLVEESVATLESILTTLEVSMEQHSVNKYTHVLTYITLESIEKRFGLSSGFLTVGLEEAGDENPEVAASGMASKIKDMLSQLKGAGAALLDKIAQGIEVVRKDVAKIAARVKQRIQAVRSNINKDNKGGIELKTGGLKRLSGIANNGVVSGTSFIPKLNSTASTVNGILNNTAKYDVLAAYVNGLKQGGSQSIEGASKVFAAYLASMKNVNFTHDYTDGDQTAASSETMINGKVIRKYGLDPEFVKSCFNDIEKAGKEIQRTIPVNNPDAITPEQGAEVKAILNNLEESLQSTSSKHKVTDGHLLKAFKHLLGWWAWGIGGAASKLLIPLIFGSGILSSGILLIVSLLCLGMVVKNVILFWVNIFRAGKSAILSTEKQGSDSQSLDELKDTVAKLPDTKVSKDALINVVIMTSIDFSITGGNNTKDVQKVESLSAKEIEKTCAVLDTICDSTMAYIGGTKDRKALISEYRKLTKKTVVTEADHDVDLSKGLTEFVKNKISFEVDLCRSMTSVLLTGITYAEASNNAVATPVEEA